MLKRIENPEVGTVAELRNLYADNWFSYVLIGEEDEWLYKPNADREAVALYTADTREELMQIPRDDLTYMGFVSGGDEWGVDVNPEPEIQIGGCEIEWSIDFHRSEQ